jgi:hypothetical protein
MSPVRYELGFYIPEDDILHSHHRENLKMLQGFMYVSHEPKHGPVSSAEKPRLTSGPMSWCLVTTLPPHESALKLIHIHAGDSNVSRAVQLQETKECRYEVLRPFHRFSEPVNHIKGAPS